MGQFLSCGIAKSIFVEKASYTKEEILKKLAKSIDLNIYKEPKENEEYLFLDLKENIIEKYAVKFIEEQLEIAKENSNKLYNTSDIKELENKKYDELMQIADRKEYESFQLLEGDLATNDISYIADDLTIIADIIIFLLDGKVIMECYNVMFRYFRNQIIRNSTNPIKTTTVISIVG